MKIELHGTGFENIKLPRYVCGVTAYEHCISEGKYPVKAINNITVLPSGDLYVAVDLRDDDEHLPRLCGIELAEVQQ